MNQTRYTLLQAVLSVEADERMTIGIIMSDGEKTDFVASPERLNLFRQWRGEEAYRMMRSIVDALATHQEQRSKIMQPSHHSYLRRYANNFVTVSPMHTTDCQLNDTLKRRLSKQYVG